MNKILKIILIVVVLLIGLICYPKKIVLTIGIFAGSNWDVPSSESYTLIDEAIALFEEKYPNVEVQYESGILKDDYSSWLADKMLAGDEPDVFMVLNSDFNTFSSLGVLENLTSYIESDINTSFYYESALEAGNYQDEQYALPYECNPTLMFVNKTLLEKEGIDIPDNDWTLEDFYNICKQITKDSDGDGIIDQYGVYNYDWLDAIYAYGIDLFDEDGTTCYLNQTSVKEAISFVQKLIDLNQNQNLTSDQFDKGQIAFSPMTLAEYRTYKPYPWRIKKYSQFEWDCVKMPSSSTSTGYSEISTTLISMSSRSTHKTLAWEFLKLLTYDTTLQQNLIQYSQGISALKTVTQSDETIQIISEEAGDSLVNLSLLDEVMESTRSSSQFKKYESVISTLDTSISSMINNGEDIDLSLAALQKEINQTLNE
ncbi:MAG: sugar ABC transporter substrate-binding protein [Erysipelotrichaceae bacterium]|nr:sugar ABC transporter substrate-binding protein [Erysipelotrichaceae bacterium]